MTEHAKTLHVAEAGAGTRDGARADVARRARAELEAYGLSQSAAAHEIGFSPAVLGRWLADKYTGDVTGVTEKVARWLGTRAEARALTLTPVGLDAHAALAVTDRVMAALAHAQATGDVVLIHGRSGAGKSWAVRRYAASRSGVHALVMTCGITSLPGLYGRIARALGAGDRYRSALEAEDTILARLEGRRALLVIDEAQYLTARHLDALRGLRDLSGAGLALVGAETITMTLARCPQVTGRIGVQVGLAGPPQADVDTLVGQVLGRAPSGRETRHLSEAAAGPGGLHALRRLLARAWMIARAEARGTITEPDIEAAAGDGS